MITVVGLTSIPNIFNRNDRLSLNTSASQIRQFIIDARTRSLAPDKNDLSGSTQQYQVVFGTFANGSDPLTVSAIGGATTTSVTLERGLAQCDTDDVQGGFSTLRSYTLPRGIYISSFYPSNQPVEEDQTAIRFTVGKEGFVCGGYDKLNFNSGVISQSGWTGKNKADVNTTARYTSIVLSSQKIAEKRYIYLDRFTGEVAISRADTQSYFTPKTDSLPPIWKNTVVDTFPNDMKLSVDCGTTTSDIVITFNRANDRVNDGPADGDENLYVAYDINWDTGIGSRPLELNYFYNLSDDLVQYSFTTDSFTYSNQPHTVTVSVIAEDGIQTPQAAFDSSSPNDRTKGREKAFNPSCGNVIGEEKTDPPGDVPADIDPGGGSQACNPIVAQNPVGVKRIYTWLVGRAKAEYVPIEDLCGETTPI